MIQTSLQVVKVSFFYLVKFTTTIFIQRILFKIVTILVLANFEGHKIEFECRLPSFVQIYLLNIFGKLKLQFCVVKISASKLSFLALTLLTPCLIIGALTTSVTAGYAFQFARNLKLPDFKSSKPVDDNQEDATNEKVIKASSSSKRKEVILVFMGILFMFLSYGIDMYFQSQIYVFGLCGPFELSPSYAGKLNTTYFASYLIGRLLSIPISTILSPNGIIILALIGSGISSVLLSIFGSTNLNMLFVNTGVMGLFIAFFVGSGINWLTTNVENISSKQVSLVFLGSPLANCVFPPIASFLLYEFSPECVFYTSVSCVLVLTFCFSFMNVIAKKIS